MFNMFYIRNLAVTRRLNGLLCKFCVLLLSNCFRHVLFLHDNVQLDSKLLHLMQGGAKAQVQNMRCLW